MLAGEDSALASCVQRKVDPTLEVDEKPMMMRTKTGRLVPVRQNQFPFFNKRKPRFAGLQYWQYSDVEERVRYPSTVY